MLYLKLSWQQSIQRGCDLIGISKSVYYYEKQERNDDLVIRILNQLADKHTGWGFGLMFRTIRQEGHTWNRKRVLRIYREMKLNIRRKRKRRLPKREPQPLAVPQKPNQSWSMDFMTGCFTDGRKFRILNVIDDFNREALAMEIDTSISSQRAVRVLERIAMERGCPDQIRVDNGPEFISETMKTFCFKNGIHLQFIQPGKPAQNGFVERFNGTYRLELLDAYMFRNLKEVRLLTEDWRHTYNHKRPHSALNDLSPFQFANQIHS